MLDAAPELLVPAGAVIAVIGAVLTRRALLRLARAGALSSLYWRSFGHFAAYRVRALRPLGAALLGLALLGAGLVAVYSGLTAFYGSRLGRFAG